MKIPFVSKILEEKRERIALEEKLTTESFEAKVQRIYTGGPNTDILSDMACIGIKRVTEISPDWSYEQIQQTYQKNKHNTKYLFVLYELTSVKFDIGDSDFEILCLDFLKDFDRCRYWDVLLPFQVLERITGKKIDFPSDALQEWYARSLDNEVYFAEKYGYTRTKQDNHIYQMIQFSGIMPNQDLVQDAYLQLARERKWSGFEYLITATEIQPNEIVKKVIDESIQYISRRKAEYELWKKQNPK